MGRVNSSKMTKSSMESPCAICLYFATWRRTEREESGGGWYLNLFVGHVNSSTSGDERQVSILTLVHSSRALVGGNTVFALQLYLRRVTSADECF
jgi:hypothetical protein